MRCSFGKLPLLARLGFCAFVIVPQAHPPRWRFAAPLSYGGAVADERHRRLLLEERAVEADEGLPLQRHDLRLHRRLEEDPRSRGGWVRCFDFVTRLSFLWVYVTADLFCQTAIPVFLLHSVIIQPIP